MSSRPGQRREPGGVLGLAVHRAALEVVDQRADQWSGDCGGPSASGVKGACHE